MMRKQAGTAEQILPREISYAVYAQKFAFFRRGNVLYFNRRPMV
jgi:hypothetical protein